MVGRWLARVNGMRAVPVLVWLLGLWWVSHQFVALSVNNDGLLYTGDALRLLSPQDFAKDPFFMAQTQGDFSLFGKLYGQFILWFGLLPGAWSVATIGRLLWGAGVVWLARGLWARSHHAGWWIGVALMLLLPTTYDGYHMFFYGAADVTPRTWAEACVLWALGFQLRSKWWWSVGCLGMAAAFHPLMALPGLGLSVLLLPGRGWLWGSLAVLSLGCVGAVLDVGPLGQLLQTFDALWWESVVVLAGQVLTVAWVPLSLMKMACVAALLWAVGCWHTDPQLRRWGHALLGVQVIFLGLWWLGCVTQNVLLVQLQLWRVLWVCQLLAPALWWSSLPPWRQWSMLHGTQATLVMAAVVSNSMATAWLFIPALGLQWPRVTPWLGRADVRRAVFTTAVALLLISLAVRFPEFVARARLHEIKGLPHPFWMAVAEEPMCSLPLSAGVAWVWMSGRMSWPWRHIGVGVALVSMVTVCAGVVSTQIDRISQPLPKIQALRAVIAPGSLVYWDQDLNGSWQHLRHGQYLSTLQGPAGLFSREVAIEYRRRLAHLASTGFLGTDLPSEAIATLPYQAGPYTEEAEISVLSFVGEVRGRLEILYEQRKFPSVAMVPTLCRDPILDYVLISRDLPEATWRVPYEGVPSGVVSVFKCVR